MQALMHTLCTLPNATGAVA